MKVPVRVFMIALGIVACLGAGSAVFVVLHRTAGVASPEVAARAFAEVRARFPGQEPLVDMRERRARPGLRDDGHGHVHSLHAMIFDTRGGQRLVHVSVPYWLAAVVRGRSGFRYLGELTWFDDTEFDPEAIQVSFDDLAKHGPRLLVDCQHEDGGRFMAWAE